MCFRPGALAAADEADDEITLHDAKRGLYKKIILRDDKVVGCVLYGNVADGPWYVQLMRDKTDVSSFRDQIVFGRALAEQATAALARSDIAVAPNADAHPAPTEPQWQAALIRTTCPYCGVGCGVRVAADGMVVRRPGPSCQSRPALLERRGAWRHARYRRPIAAPADRRPQCELGRSARPASPRTFTQTIAEHGPDAVALYVSGQFLTEDYYVANKLMKGFIGSGNIDTNSRLCMASSVAGHVRAFGEDIVPGCYEDIEAADLVVLVGSNTAWCHPVLYQRLAAAREKRGTKSRRHRSAAHARPATSPTCISRYAPGSDVAVFAGLLVHLAADGTCDAAWTQKFATGFADARRGCAEVSAFARRRCGDCRRAGRRSCAVLRLVRRHRAHRDASTRKAPTSLRPAPTRSMRSSTAIWRPAASDGRAWDRFR